MRSRHTDLRLWGLFTICGALPMAGAALAGRLPFGSVRSLIARLTGGGAPPPARLLAELLAVAVTVLVLAWLGQVAAVRSGVRFPAARPEQADDYRDPPAG